MVWCIITWHDSALIVSRWRLVLYTLVICRAKILEFNSSSLALFKQLGFVQTKRVPVFSEVHLELDASKGTEAYTRLHDKAVLQKMHSLST